MSDDKRPSLRGAADNGVPPQPRRPKPPVVGTEQVAARCGHAVPFELFEPKKDKFRDDRRQKLTDRDCSACRVKAQAEREAAEMEAARKRRAEKPKPEADPGGPVAPRLALRGEPTTRRRGNGPGRWPCPAWRRSPPRPLPCSSCCAGWMTCTGRPWRRQPGDGGDANRVVGGEG